MNGAESALEHVRNTVATAEALKLKFCAVQIADLKWLLEMAEIAAQREGAQSHENAQ
jgi:hypothetical protein